jgi:hypothetical protein
VFALLTLAISAGCVNTQDSAVTDGPNKMLAIVLPAPSDAELATLQGGGKNQPYRVGAGRQVPATENKVTLSNLSWRQDQGSYKTMISVQSVGARAIRVGMRLNNNVPGLELSFSGSNAILRGSAIVSASTKDIFWSPVLNGDTATIELTVPELPKKDAVLEVPTVSHLP